MKNAIGLLGIGLAVVIGGCSNSDGGGPTSARGPRSVTVELTDALFSPDEISVGLGGTVHWENLDDFDHTVTSGVDDEAADAGEMFDHPMPEGDSFQFTFTQIGSVPYFCRIHDEMGMKGTITVIQ